MARELGQRGLPGAVEDRGREALVPGVALADQQGLQHPPAGPVVEHGTHRRAGPQDPRWRRSTSA